MNLGHVIVRFIINWLSTYKMWCTCTHASFGTFILRTLWQACYCSFTYGAIVYGLFNLDGVFRYIQHKSVSCSPQKLKFYRAWLFKFLKLRMDPKNHRCNISRQSVYKWTSTSILKVRAFRKVANKWRFVVDCCFCLNRVAPGKYTKQCFILQIMLDWTASINLILGSTGKHTASSVSLRSEG